MSVEIITFKKLGFFPRLLGLFFLFKYSFTRAMLQLEFGESKPDESQSEQSITETRKAASCSSETLNAGNGPAAAGCPVSNPDNLWKSPLFDGLKTKINFHPVLNFALFSQVRKYEIKYRTKICDFTVWTKRTGKKDGEGDMQYRQLRRSTDMWGMHGRGRAEGVWKTCL